MKFKHFLLISALFIETMAYGVLAGGRPNTYSGGNNAFAGVVNPANAVWIADRFDIGAFWVHQKSNITNHGAPSFPPGKTDFTYRATNLWTGDIAIHKHFNLPICSENYDCSISLAAYTLPGYAKARTKYAIPSRGTTPVQVINKTDALSAIFSIKLNSSQSIGMTIDYLYFSHKRNGFQNSDNPLRSVSPGNVTNRGLDHSSGVSINIGWRWNITEKLHFGTAWTRKGHCGQYRRYRGFEPHHAKNFNPQTVGAGFTYIFTKQLAGRIEVLWSNYGNLPGSNNSILPNGAINTNKRGSRKSPGPGLQDATFINMGLGYIINPNISLGTGYSYRFKIGNSPTIISHSYRLQTIYQNFVLGSHLKFGKQEMFIVFSHGLRNKVSGKIPEQLGGGRLTSVKHQMSLSVSWGRTF